MASPKASPFTGAKLSSQVGLDQQLFSGQPSQPPTQRPSGRKDVRTEERPAVRKNEGKAEPSKVRPANPSTRNAKVTNVERIVEHRPYDFYQDQVRWLNRKKVEFEEEYGQRVPGTAMVQLAIDLLIADYEANREESQLIRVLIREERPSVRPFGSSDERTD